MTIAGLSVPFVSSRELPGSRFKGIFKLFGGDVGIDLGTANTLIHLRGEGIVLNEPSVVAYDEKSGKVSAIGHEAKQIFGKTARCIKCIRPIKDGVISDFQTSALMLSTLLKRALPVWRLQKPRGVIGIPSCITQVEKRAVIDAALSSGLRQVILVEEPMAAAVGADLPIETAVGNMIVDIGGGTTEIAVISLNGTVYSQSIRVAGDEMDEAIQRAIKRASAIEVGIFEAERIKLLLGSALPLQKSRSLIVSGRDISSSIPQQVEVSDEFVREALDQPVRAIISAVATALEQLAPEVANDLVARGINLAGGGALLAGLDQRLYREIGIRVHRVQDPLSCVARGVGTIVENLRQLKKLCVS
jgi:rod shape-determining protein MreB